MYYDGPGPSGFRGRARFLIGAVFLNREEPLGLFGFDEEPGIPRFPFAPGFTMIHELFHTFGAVESCAPNADGGSHVTDDPQDIMAVPRSLSLPDEGEEEDFWPTWVVDRDHDDYRDIADSGSWEVVRDRRPPNEPSSAPTGRQNLLWRVFAGRRDSRVGGHGSGCAADTQPRASNRGNGAVNDDRRDPLSHDGPRHQRCGAGRRGRRRSMGPTVRPRPRYREASGIVPWLFGVIVQRPLGVRAEGSSRSGEGGSADLRNSTPAVVCRERPFV